MRFKAPKFGSKKPAAEASSSKSSDRKGKKTPATEPVAEASSSKSDRKGKKKAQVTEADAEASPSKGSDRKGKKSAPTTEAVADAFSSKSSDRKGKKNVTVSEPDAEASSSELSYLKEENKALMTLTTEPGPVTPDEGKSPWIEDPEYDPLKEEDLLKVLELGRDPAVREWYLQKIKAEDLKWEQAVEDKFGFPPRILPGEPPMPTLPNKPSFARQKRTGGPWVANPSVVDPSAPHAVSYCLRLIPSPPLSPPL
ncbi:hypothetical protein F5Y03DRAFT_126862 [Xylaria venustula]|nr:hypothetical protein F5Y03DRAFT_126862 [Xylaria venustula]